MQTYRILHTIEGFYVPQRLYSCGWIAEFNSAHPYDFNFETVEMCACYIMGRLANSLPLHKILMTLTEETDVLAQA